MQHRPLRLTAGAQRRLRQGHWPGHVRELENCLGRAAVMSESREIDADLIRIDKPRERAARRSGSGTTPATPSAQPVSSIARGSGAGGADDGIDPGSEPSERERVIAALERAGWVQARAARLLGMTPRQIAYRVQILNIEMKQI